MRDENLLLAISLLIAQKCNANFDFNIKLDVGARRVETKLTDLYLNFED